MVRLINFKILLFITLGISYAIANPMVLLAQSDAPDSNRSQAIKIPFIPPANSEDPPDRGTPTANEGTGSRGDCLYKEDMPTITSLVGSDRLKLTTKEHPRFWVYVPYTSKEAPSGEFSLQDGDDDVYRTPFELPETPGIVAIALPSTIPPLEVGKKYRWYFDINCPDLKASNDSSTPASLTGMVERVTPSSQLQQDLNAAQTPLERIKIYALHGIWYETLTELAQMRQISPNNPSVEAAWVNLLSEQNVSLEKVAREPIVGTVTIGTMNDE